MKKSSIIFFLPFFCGQVLYAQEAVQAQPANDFLNSIGMNSSISSRQETIAETMKCADYMGFRWIRSGMPDGVTTRMVHLKRLYEEYGVRFTYIMPDNGDSMDRVIESAKDLITEAGPDALIAFEGPNEPNNWGIKYQGEYGGGRYGADGIEGPNPIAPLARYQRDFYAKIKADPVLKDYPVWSMTDVGAMWENCGLHFLTVPENAEGVDPEFLGVTFADVAACHNYFSGIQARTNNQTWRASDPCGKTGNTLYANFGVTWNKKYQGYSEEELQKLPRVCTETGTTIDGLQVTEEYQGLTYLSCYLSQFKRGWTHTAIYILRDRTDEGGNQTFGFYTGNYTPRLAAHYLHNLTTVLDDDQSIETPGTLTYSIDPLPATTHDLLLQKNDGTMMLVVWSEKYARGSTADDVTVTFDESIEKINVYNPAQYDENDPDVGTRPIATYENVNAIELSMLDHPYIIEINPVASGVEHVAVEEQRPLVEYLENPVMDCLTFNATEELQKVELFDLAGKCVFQQSSLQDGINYLDVASIAGGSYILKAISVNEQAESHRVILK